MSQADEPELDELKRLLRRLERVQSEDRHSARPVDFLEELSAALDPQQQTEPEAPETSTGEPDTGVIVPPVPGHHGQADPTGNATGPVTALTSEEPVEDDAGETSRSAGKQSEPDFPRHLDRRLWDMPEDSGKGAADTWSATGQYPPPAVRAGSSHALVRGEIYDEYYEPPARAHRVAIIAAVCSAIITAPLAVGLTAYLIRPELLEPVLVRFNEQASISVSNNSPRAPQTVGADTIATPTPTLAPATEAVTTDGQPAPAGEPDTPAPEAAEPATDREVAATETSGGSSETAVPGLTSEIRQVAVKAIMSAIEASRETIPAGLATASGTSLPAGTGSIKSDAGPPHNEPDALTQPEKVVTRVEPLADPSGPGRTDPASATMSAGSNDVPEDASEQPSTASPNATRTSSATRIMPPEELEPLGPAVEVIANLPDGRVANNGGLSLYKPRAVASEGATSGPVLEAPDRLQIIPGQAQDLPLRLVDRGAPAATARDSRAFAVQVIDVPDTVRLVGGERLSRQVWRISAEALPKLQIVTQAPFREIVTLRLQVTDPDGRVRQERELQLRPRNPS